MEFERSEFDPRLATLKLHYKGSVPGCGLYWAAESSLKVWGWQWKWWHETARRGCSCSSRTWFVTASTSTPCFSPSSTSSSSSSSHCHLASFAVLQSAPSIAYWFQLFCGVYLTSRLRFKPCAWLLCALLSVSLYVCMYVCTIHHIVFILAHSKVADYSILTAISCIPFDILTTS